jgi:hypothetical protein
VPHPVIKQEEKELEPEPQKKKTWYEVIESYYPSANKQQSKNVTEAPQVDSPFDDLGLSVPGTRNISINHQFKYFNYTEINMLNMQPEYRFEKKKREETDAKAEFARFSEEQRQKYLDKRKKVRPAEKQFEIEKV